MTTLRTSFDDTSPYRSPESDAGYRTGTREWRPSFDRGRVPDPGTPRTPDTLTRTSVHTRTFIHEHTAHTFECTYNVYMYIHPHV